MANASKPSSFRAEILLVAGVGCLLWAVAPWSLEQSPSKEAMPPSNTVKTTAKVLQIEEKKIGAYGREIYPLLGFIDSQGKRHQSWGPRGVNGPHYEQGETVEIHYAPDTGEVLWTDKQANYVRGNSLFLFWVSKIFGALCLIFVIGLADTAEKYQSAPRLD